MGIHKGKVKRIGLVYLIRIYMLLATVVITMLLMVLQGFYGFSVPFVPFNVSLLDDYTWTTRFRILTTQLMFLPLLFGGLVVMMCWPPFSDTVPYWDDLFLLKIDKDKILYRVGRIQVSSADLHIWEEQNRLLRDQSLAAPIRPIHHTKQVFE
eukprot:TRINITY_DN4517_c0_g1_i2.p1 TRINITY_DN4517_c0_g1~~TRINITY_DN4517_c0_g1_i2.p1  ORF type:complete len:153 (-),score=41.47 TRINITY_DN4517_c0_g1_i2:111-569(-)